MHSLKSLVVVLGGLIVIAFGLLIYALVTKVANPEFRVLKSTRNEAASPRDDFADVRVALPAGCAVVEMQPHGDRLLLRTGPAGACERIIVVDIATGRQVGVITFAP